MWCSRDGKVMKQIPKTMWVILIGLPLLIVLVKLIKFKGEFSSDFAAIVGWYTCILSFSLGAWASMRKQQKLLNQDYGLALVMIYKHKEKYVITPHNIKASILNKKSVHPQKSILVSANTCKEIETAFLTALERSENKTKKNDMKPIWEQIGYTQFATFYKDYDLVAVKKFADRYLLQRIIKFEGKYYTTDEKMHTLELANTVSTAEILAKVEELFELQVNNVPQMHEFITQGGYTVKYLLPIQAALSEINSERPEVYKIYQSGKHMLTIANIELANMHKEAIYAKWTQEYGELIEYQYLETGNMFLPYLATGKTNSVELVGYFYADKSNLLSIQYQIDLSVPIEEVAQVRAGFEALVTVIRIERTDDFAQFGYYLVSDKVLEGEKICYCYREYPNFQNNNGWVLLSEADIKDNFISWNNIKVIEAENVSQAVLSIVSAKYGTMLRWLYEDRIHSGFYDMHTNKHVALAEIIMGKSQIVSIVKAKKAFNKNKIAVEY